MNIVFGLTFIEEDLKPEESDTFFKVKTVEKDVMVPILVIPSDNFITMADTLKDNVDDFLEDILKEFNNRGGF